MYSMISYIKNQFKSSNNIINLPISEIDGVKVDVKLIYTFRVTSCRLVINNKFAGLYNEIIWDDSDREYAEIGLDHYTNEDIETSLFMLQKVLEQLRFDKFEGEYSSIIQEGIGVEWIKLLKVGKVKLSIEECCVCNDLTRTKTTNCDHPLCHSCSSKLKFNDDNVCLCPICRQELETLFD